MKTTSFKEFITTNVPEYLENYTCKGFLIRKAFYMRVVCFRIFQDSQPLTIYLHTHARVAVR